MTAVALFPVTVQGKVGYIDSKGKLRIKSRFDFSGFFSEGLALCGDWDPERRTDPVSRGWRAKCGFINEAGEVVIPPTYDQALDFKDGLAPVRAGKHWGFINAMGETVIEPQFDQVAEFSEGLGSARVKKKWQILDGAGKVVFAVEATTVAPCHDGLLRCEKQRKWSYLNRKGKTAIALVCTAAEDFSEGLAAVLKDRRIGYIDTKGDWAIPPRFDQGSRFSDGYARVEFARPNPYDPTQPQDFGFVDRTGNRNPPGSFVDAGLFAEGLVAVRRHHGDGWGYIDANGKTKIPPLADGRPGEFRDGLAPIEIKEPATGESRWGYIDRKGRYVWEPQA